MPSRQKKNPQRKLPRLLGLSDYQVIENCRLGNDLRFSLHGKSAESTYVLHYHTKKSGGGEGVQGDGGVTKGGVSEAVAKRFDSKQPRGGAVGLWEQNSDHFGATKISITNLLTTWLKFSFKAGFSSSVPHQHF